MGISIPGLASGLDSAELIKSLMQLEAIPQTLLKNKATLTTNTNTVLQALNTRIADLAEFAKTTATPEALDLHTATSSSDSVTATVGAGAGAGSLDITVDALARKQTSVSDAVTGWSGDLTIDGPNGAVTVTATSLDALATAINNSEAGVTAMKVSAGTDALGEKLYRLQFSSAETGAASAFSVTGLGTTVTGTAQDASVTLWGGTAAEQTVTSASNTFEDLLPGVAVTVSAVSALPVTLTVARDTQGATKAVADFVTKLTDVFTFIDTRSKVSTTTDATGNPVTSGGVFQGDSTVRSAKDGLMSAISMPINGHSPSEIGISVTKTGTIEFDAEKFAAALAEDPAKVEAAIAGLAERVAASATLQSDKYDGVLTSKITGQESLARNLNDQIAEWDNRLAKRQSNLERTYAALEVRMSALNSQSSWLSSQIASLPTYGGNDK